MKRRYLWWTVVLVLVVLAALLLVQSQRNADAIAATIVESHQLTWGAQEIDLYATLSVEQTLTAIP